MKKIFTLFFISFFTLILVDSVSANDNDLNLDLSKAEIVYQDDDITIGYFGNDPEIAKQIEESSTSVSSVEEPSLITPFQTVTGPGGKVTIDAGDNGRVIYWSVKPATAWPWAFTGEIQLRYYSGFKRDAAIFGTGGLGLSASGFVSMNENNGGIAHLKGTAFAIEGSQFKVLPGASTPF